MADNLTKTSEVGAELQMLWTWQSIMNRLTHVGKSFYIWLALSAAVLCAGVAAGVHGMIVGYAHVYNTSREIAWGILISTYVFFVVTSTGLCLVSSIGHVFGVRDFMPIAKRSVFLSILTIVAGFMVIFFEIENPVRMAIYNVISPNLTSNIWWMGTLYGAYLVFMAIEFVCLQIERHKLATYAGFLGVISGVAAHSNLGAVFGMLMARPFWYGPFMPIYFIASAMMSGCAAIILFTWLAAKVNRTQLDARMFRAVDVTRQVGILMISVIMFFTTWKIIAGLVGGDAERETFLALLSGPYAFNFWVLEVGAGMLFPLAMYIMSRGSNLNMLFYGSASMIFGIFFMRYDLVVVGQIVPAQYELGVNEYATLLSYIPSPHEILVVLAGIGLVGTFFLLGEKIFSEHVVEEHESEHAHQTVRLEAVSGIEQ
ncbi:MAG TPA: NrfD/PsrC family molybdoenzyme membrane anchor subunit [Dissulfurispiraceae bacterium]|nr:NrfD/PsrC family molybdoenzyme membrane anchor subunit [Dissulfurispiraceae bacterium]